MAGTRVTVAGAVGLVVAVAVGLAGGWAYAASAGWDVAAVVFLVWTWMVIAPMGAADTAAHATAEDPSRRVTSLITLGAAVASLAGVGYLLVRASTAKGTEQGLVAGLGVGSVAVSWLVVHTLFTLRYAVLYYTDHPAGPGGEEADKTAGVDFNQTAAPRYTDFAYLAFTIGMTFQVSDTTLTTHRMRASALRHALLSYLFGSLILAATVNLIASLASSSH